MAVAVLPGPGGAEAPREDWRDREHLTGDWGGRRALLDQRGIRPYARYTTGFWSNLRGGLEKGTRYEGFASWGIDLDLDALIGWQGTSFHADWHSYHGGQPSSDLIGAFAGFALSNWEAEGSIRFYNLYVRQALLDGRLRIKAGQITVDEQFMVSKQASLFLNSVFGDFVSSTSLGATPSYPIAAPGAIAELRPSQHFAARAGVFTADPGKDERENFGFDWSLHSGAVLFGELEASAQPLGRTGRYSLGIGSSTANLVDFGTGGEAEGAYSLYAMIDQELWAAASGSSHLSVFARGNAAPQEDRVPVRWHVDAGLDLYGPLPGRAADVLGAAFSLEHFASDYRAFLRTSGENPARRQLLIEVTYRIQLAPWLTLQPDLQVILDPLLSRSDSLAVGLRAVIRL